MSRRIHLSVLFIASIAYCAFPQSPKRLPPVSEVVAFVNVNVISMDRTQILTNQTVIIKNEHIAQIGPAQKTKVPKGALRINGKDKYLMPGLIDMHTHLYSPDSRSLLPYLATGVTTMRVMNGRPSQLEWREQISRGELLGPTLYVACPTIYGRANSSSERAGFKEPTTAGEASQLVVDYKRAGYDFIKVYSFLSPEIYAAIIKAAKERSIRVVGHVPWSVGVQGVLAVHQSSIEHLFGYLESLETEESQKRSAADFRNLFHAVEFHENRLAALARATRDAGVWNTPTMVFFEKRLPFSGAREAWDTPSLRKLGHENRKKVVRALSDAGARLLLGTDSGEGQGSVLPAAILEELELLVEADLTPYDAIKTGTVNAAEYLGGARVLVQFDVRQALACRSSGDKLKFVGHFIERQPRTPQWERRHHHQGALHLDSFPPVSFAILHADYVHPALAAKGCVILKHTIHQSGLINQNRERAT